MILSKKLEPIHIISIRHAERSEASTLFMDMQQTQYIIIKHE